MRIQNLLLLTALSIIILAPTVTRADLKKCGDIWTNGECDDATSTQVIPEKALRKPPAENTDLDIKKAMIRDMVAFRQDTAREYKLSLSSLSVEQFCTRAATSIKDCREEIEKFEEKIYTRLKIENERVKAEEEKRGDDETNVVVITQPDTYWLRRNRLLRRLRNRATNNTVTGQGSTPTNNTPPPSGGGGSPASGKINSGSLQKNL